MVVAAPFIAMGLALAGAAVSAVGAIRQGKAEANQAEAEAEIARQQAENERTVSRQESEDFRRNQASLFAKRRAILGASGVQTATGSPLLASEDFAAEVELGERRIRAGGELRATRLSQQAGLYDASASNARTGSYLRSGSLLIGGAGQAASLWPK